MVLLATRLPRDRFHIEVAALTRLGPLEEDLRAAEIPVTLINKRLKVDPIALVRLTRFMKERQFDVVQTWIFAANVYGRVAARRAKVPVIITAEMAVDLWKGPVERGFDRYLAHWTDRVVGNSNAVVDYYRDVGIPEDRLGMIYSGIGEEEPPEVDRAQFREELNLPDDSPIAIFVGRLMPQKSVGDLIHALDILQHVRPDLRTLIVGEGPEREQLEIAGRAATLLDQSKVLFLGHRSDVPRLLAGSDLLVLPSLFEGLPNVVLEAMRFRKPVVATDAPGTTEVVIDGETGILVPRRSPAALARAIKEIIDNPQRAQAFGEAGRARVEAQFGVDLMIERFASLYEQIYHIKQTAQDPHNVR